MQVDLLLTFRWICPVCQGTHYHNGSIVRERPDSVLECDLPEGEWMMLPEIVTCPECRIEFDVNLPEDEA